MVTVDQASEGAVALARVNQWQTFVQNLQSDIAAGAQLSNVVLTNGRSYNNLETLLTASDSAQIIAAVLTMFEAKLAVAEAALAAI